MVRTGEVYEWDWSADDVDATGRVRTVLTNCFRIWDADREKWLLAELGIDISELDRASQQLRRVQEEALMEASARMRLLQLRGTSDIGQAIAELGDDGTLSSVVRTIFNAVRRVVSGTPPKGHLWLFNGDETTEHRDEPAPPLPFDEAAAIDLLRQDIRPLFFDPTSERTAASKIARRERRGRARSFAILPLVDVRNARKLSGLLAVNFGDNRRITAADKEALTVFATQVGSLLAIATEMQRRRKEGAKRVQDETKELVIRSVLHTVGNDAYTLQGRAYNLLEEAERLGIEPGFRANLASVEAAAVELGDSMRELREQLARSDQAEALPLAEPVEAVVQPLRLHHQQVDVQVRVSRDLVVQAPRSWVRHAVNNVISNGVQVLEEVDGGGLIDVWAQRVNGWVELHVEDDGPGVDREIRGTLFNEGVSRRRGGSGHGLVMAKDLIVMCGGTLELVGKSRRHSGAHFRMRLPASAASAPADST